MTGSAVAGRVALALRRPSSPRSGRDSVNRRWSPAASLTRTPAAEPRVLLLVRTRTRSSLKAGAGPAGVSTGPSEETPLRSRARIRPCERPSPGPRRVCCGRPTSPCPAERGRPQPQAQAGASRPAGRARPGRPERASAPARQKRPQPRARAPARVGRLAAPAGPWARRGTASVAMLSWRIAFSVVRAERGRTRRRGRRPGRGRGGRVFAGGARRVS
jgi:hypothetical protein